MTVHPYLDMRRTRKKGLYSLYIRVISGSKIKLLPTGYKLGKHQWAKNTVTKHPDAAIINAKVSDMVSTINRAAAECTLKNKPFDLSKLSPGSRTFADYLTHRAEQYKQSDQSLVASRVLKLSKELATTGEMTFDEMTVDRLRKHDAYLKKQGNNDNTRSKKFARLRAYFAAAITEGWTNEPNNFLGYKISPKPVKKEKLSVSDIEKIEKLKLTGEVDLARDIFLFSYYTKGQRFATCITIPRSEITDRVGVKMNKGQKYISVKIHSRLQKIIDKYPEGKYLFDLVKQIPKGKKEYTSLISSKNTVVNRNLKIVAGLAGIKVPISMHIARHSFAFHLKHTATSIGVISDSLGHSSASVTERYLKQLGDEILDKEMEKVYGV